MKIKEFNVFSFWGKYDIHWEMKPDVNVLVGINGMGKSSLLKLLAFCLDGKKDEHINWREVAHLASEVEIIFENEGKISKIKAELTSYQGGGEIVRSLYGIRLSDLNTTAEIPLIVKTFDNSTQNVDTILGISDDEFKKGLIGHFFNYRNKKITEILDNNLDIKNECADIFEFFNLIDKCFIDSNKKINQSFGKQDIEFELVNDSFKTKVSVNKLSSGEKQLLVLFFAAFLQHKKPSCLLIDEPETSLHTLWQETLFTDLLKINPNCQLIVVTHSPATFGFDWMSNKFNIERLFLETDKIQRTENSTFIEQTKSKIDLNSLISKDDTTYTVNHKLKELLYISYKDAEAIISKMKEKNLSIDTITLTTLVNNLNCSIQEAERLLTNSNATPTIFSLNVLLKKVTSVAEGILFIQSFCQKNNTIQPDIITLSTLLSKARNADEVKSVEELRIYHSVKSNDIYESRLEFKLSIY